MNIIFGFVFIAVIICIIIYIIGSYIKIECLICDKQYDYWNTKHTADYFPICIYCLKKANITNYKNYTLKEIKEIIYGKEILETYSYTHKIANFIAIDDNKKTWSPFPFTSVYKYDDLIDYEIIENGTTISTSSKGLSGLGKAAIGGILFGGAGAIVGAVTADSKTKTTNTINNITKLEIKITVNNLNIRNIFIDMSNGDSNNLKKINLLRKQVQDIVSILDIIKQSQIEKNINKNPNTNFSEADEIVKFKKLMDEGVITQEEFEYKKKQILKIGKF